MESNEPARTQIPDSPRQPSVARSFLLLSLCGRFAALALPSPIVCGRVWDSDAGALLRPPGPASPPGAPASTRIADTDRVRVPRLLCACCGRSLGDAEIEAQLRVETRIDTCTSQPHKNNPDETGNNQERENTIDNGEAQVCVPR